MEKANQPTSIANGLLVPDNLFLRAVSLVFCLFLVFLDAELLVCLADGKNKQQGVGRPRHKSKEFRLVDAEDVVEGQLLRQAELVDEARHDLWVVFWGVLLDAGRRGGWDCVLPSGTNRFLPLGTSGEASEAMLVLDKIGVAGKEA